jgi:hypothetical protein
VTTTANGTPSGTDVGRAADVLPSPLDSVADMRATARWTLVAVGAVGAVLISGGPLVAIGQVHGAGNTFRALLGLIIVVAGVGVAAWFTSQVLMPRLATPDMVRKSPELATLRRQINAEPAEFMGVVAATVDDLFDLHDQLRANALDLARQAAREKDPQRRAALDGHLSRMRAQEENVARYVRWVLALGHAWLTGAYLTRSRIATLGGGVIVALGAVLFFTATGGTGTTYVPVLTPSPAATHGPPPKP